MLLLMTAYADLLAIAYKAERSASRKLAERGALPLEETLRSVLEARAGGAGLAALVAERTAMLAASAARTAARQAEKSHALSLRKARHDGPASGWRAWFDGSAHPNPGRCGIGGVVLAPSGMRIELSQGAGFGNSSEAEYRALIALLEAARDAGARCLTVYGDSQVVINDLAASEAASAPALRELRAAAALLIASQAVTLRWIPRHKNGAADALSQQARQPA
jgi:ribonuclease HI